MFKVRAVPNILLLGSYGRGNIGDDAFFIAAVTLFKESNLYVNSTDDELLPSIYGTKVETISTTSNREIFKKIIIFIKIDTIAYCGGDLWVELEGERFPRKSLYKMLILNIVARIFLKRINYIGCGVGALKGYSLILAKASARLADTISVRDKHSQDILGKNKTGRISDLSILLNFPNTRNLKPKKNNKIIVGISILYSIPDAPNNFKLLIASLAEFIKTLDDNLYEVVLYPMLVSDENKTNDLWASKELKNTVNQSNVHIFRGRELNTFLESLNKVDIMIGTRLHANILATLAGVPCIGIAYRPKVKNFFQDNGMGKYCLNLEQIDRLSILFFNSISDYKRMLNTTNTTRRRMLKDKGKYYMLSEKIV